MKALVVGASSGVGRALCEELAKIGTDLLIVSSDKRDLKALASHLHNLYSIEVKIVEINAFHVSESIEKINKIAIEFGLLESLYFPIGVSSEDDCGFLGIQHSIAILNANLTIVIGLVSHFLPLLDSRIGSQIVGFGSISASRGRKKNIVYAAAKRGLDSYFESLRHLMANSKIRVQFYQLGYVSTQQTFGKRLMFPTVSAQQVAQVVLRNRYKDIGKVFFPRYWTLIIQIILWMPWNIFKKLDF